MNNSMRQNAKTQDVRLQVERWQMNRGRCCWQHTRANSWKHFNKTLLAVWIMSALDEAQLIIRCKELNSGMLLICLLNTSAVTILNTHPMKEKHCTSIYWWILKHCLLSFKDINTDKWESEECKVVKGLIKIESTGSFWACLNRQKHTQIKCLLWWVFT